jgi:cell division inhibitor SepF
MPGIWQKTMVYLGLKDEDDDFAYGDEYAESYEEYEEPEHPAPRPVARPERERPLREPAPVRTADAPRVRALPADEVGISRDTGPTPMIRPVLATSARVHVVEPQGFNDAQEVGDRLKADQPVIINLQGLGRDLQRRLIDFSSGLTYAVGGTMSRVADQVFLLTPSNVEVSQEEKERLQARGLYRA